MRCVVTFVFGPEQVLELPVDVATSASTSQRAREWFEASWVQLECESSQVNDKVLLLDKILSVTEALGYPLLSGSDEDATELATQIALVLRKPCITVDLRDQTVGF